MHHVVQQRELLAGLPPVVEFVGLPGTGHVAMLDQSVLPLRVEVCTLRTAADVADAIRTLKVRGAPAIGISAAYGFVLGAARAVDAGWSPQTPDHLRDLHRLLASTRPTAVNLFYCLDRILARALVPPTDRVSDWLDGLLHEAHAMHSEDAAACEAMGVCGADLIAAGSGVLTHCNAGALATGGIGTATAPMYVSHQQGKPFRVFCDETRPVFQGSRLTAWELTRRGIDATLICDNMAAAAMRQGLIQLVIVGADRIAANGDVANKIGTYSVAILAKYHGIPFYVAAPHTTFDTRLSDGSQIPIEQRRSDEVTAAHGHPVAEASQKVWNPAFDVTPAELIAGLITDRGIVPASREGVARVAAAKP